MTGPDTTPAARQRQLQVYRAMDPDRRAAIAVQLSEDVWRMAADGISRNEFERRVPLRVLGIDLWSATPEDTILAKLEWARMGASDRQVRDAAAVLAVRADDIDNAHLDRWAIELGVSDLLERARSG